MKFPTRPPRNEPSLEKYNYYDHEAIIQDDGTIAAFTWEKDRRNEGWRFVGYKDKHNFNLWSEEDRSRQYSEGVTFNQLLIDSKKQPLDPFEAIRNGIKPEEAAYNYSYGGMLSGRGGIFVVNRNEPNKIIRARMDWMS
jgi:hypothetical protein